MGVSKGEVEKIFDEKMKGIENIILKTVDKKIKEYVAKFGNMPNPVQPTSQIFYPPVCQGQVTEIIIRVGTTSDVKILGGNYLPCPAVCKPCGCDWLPGLTEAQKSLDADTKNLVKKILEITRDTEDEFFGKLSSDIFKYGLVDAIKKYEQQLSGSA